MPATDDRLKTNYPTNGWSSWFGAYRGTEYPSAMPYGIIVRAPGSTGIFKPFNHRDGVRFPLFDVTTEIRTDYISTFQPPLSDLPAFIEISLGSPTSTHFVVRFYTEVAMPPFVYEISLDKFWENTRKEITLPNFGPPPFPLVSRVGPFVSLTPWNRRGWELI